MSAPQQPLSNPRVNLARKHNKRSGIAAYGAIIRKYNFKPSLPGPWAVLDELVHGGQHASVPLRWKYDKDAPIRPTVSQRRVVQRGLVDAKDVGNDTEYLVGRCAWPFDVHAAAD